MIWQPFSERKYNICIIRVNNVTTMFVVLKYYVLSAIWCVFGINDTKRIIRRKWRIISERP